MIKRILTAVLLIMAAAGVRAQYPVTRTPGSTVPLATPTFPGKSQPDGISAAISPSGTLSVPPGGVRPSAPTDDTTVPFAIGNFWRDGAGHVFQSQDVTQGYALWQQTQSALLPLDVVGLYVAAASYVSGGGSCVTNEVLTFTGGAQIKVTTCAAGVPSVSTILTPNMFACMPGSPSTLTPLITTGGDGSSVWNFSSILTPTGYGMRKLTRCYSGEALNVVRSDTGEASDIGFLSDGSLDTATLDGFTAGPVPMAQYVEYSSGVNPRVAKWYDQGGGGNDAPQATAANQPVIFTGRLLGNSRSIMFDGRTAPGTEAWDPPAATFLTLPSGVAAAGNNFTIAALAGVVSNYDGFHLIHIGAQSSQPLIYLANNGAAGTMCQNNNSNKIAGAPGPDEATLYLCTATSSSTTLYVGNAVNSGGEGSSTVLSGGTLGEVWNATQSQPADEAMVLIVPWALSATQQIALQASVANTFGTNPQKRGVIVSVGDSHVDAWGYPYQQTFLRQAESILGRPDISFVDVSQSGAQISVYITSPSIWTDNVLPALAGYNGNKFVRLEGGYNDLQHSQTVSEVEGSYIALAASAHSAGAKVICDTDVIRYYSTYGISLNTNVQAIAAWMAANPSVCDYVFNYQQYSVFDSAAGPWPLPWFEQGDSGEHMSAAGNGLRAAMESNFIRSMLQWSW